MRNKIDISENGRPFGTIESDGEMPVGQLIETLKFWDKPGRTVLAATPFQDRVQPWMMACFGLEISADKIERNHRFLEEALELVQSTGCTQSEAHQLVDYVYGRPVGETHQEIGGVMVTLAALCLAIGEDMQVAGETELARIWTKVEKIRAKQAAKPKHSPLPEHPALALSPDAQMDGASMIAAERLRQIDEEGWTAEHDDAEYHDGELHRAAAAYVLSGMKIYRIPTDLARGMKGIISAIWPWDEKWFKPISSIPSVEKYGVGAGIRTLVKAGALIAAEIDQRQRRRKIGGGNG